MTLSDLEAARWTLATPLLALVLSVALTSCAGSSRASYTVGDTLVLDGSPEDVAAIAAQGRAFSAAYVAGDAEALVAIYAEDGIAAPGGRDFIRGRDSLLSFWTLPDTYRITRHQAVPTELRIDGDIAYDWGYYEGEGQQAGQDPQPFGGKYIIVWQRDADGAWRIANDMWNSLSSD